MSKFQTILILSTIGILLILVILILNLQQKNLETMTISATPTLKPIIQAKPTIIKLPKKIISSLPQPKKVEHIPTLLPTQGLGIDITSQEVTDSQSEIQKLSPFLPYEKNVITSNGIPVQIFIAPTALQENPWTITIQIYGLDFQTPQGKNAAMKQAFREVADDTFSWMSAQEADPKKIIIRWGDREFVHTKAEEWLQ